jgi:hypothetical protein
MLASVIGCLRFTWAGVLDFQWASYKLVYGFLLCLQIVLGLSFTWVASFGRGWFALWVCLIVYCEGGHFSLLPVLFKRLFGSMATKAYGIAFSYAGLSSCLILLVVKLMG